jgi:hypothetical protein
MKEYNGIWVLLFSSIILILFLFAPNIDTNQKIKAGLFYAIFVGLTVYSRDTRKWVIPFIPLFIVWAIFYFII